MKTVKFVLNMIPIGKLVANLPFILSFVMNKAWKRLSTTNPQQLAKLLDLTRKLQKSLEVVQEAKKDNVIEPHEIEEFMDIWRK